VQTFAHRLAQSKSNWCDLGHSAIGAAFVVKDANRQKLGYFYYEEEPGRRSVAKLPTKDETRRIAADVAKLPELLCRRQVPTSAFGRKADINRTCCDVCF
jgi:hypothetical protein